MSTQVVMRNVTALFIDNCHFCKAEIQPFEERVVLFPLRASVCSACTPKLEKNIERVGKNHAEQQGK